MRKDKGLNGDLDRLPMLTWIMFLKFLDDLEIQREGEAKLSAKKFKPAIESPYRWRDWAAQSDGITGEELLAFINNEETTLPNGKKGAGLFRYLRTLNSSNGDDRREVIATVFRGVQNRMVSGYLLRDVINKLNGIHFTASDELHTLGALYESMLREMRDAAGDSGEFYTPRPVVRFMVAVTDPRLGDTVLDPASGTGGFLVEVFNHLSKQVKTVADRRVLQEKSLFGCEPKTLPYLLCQMNLLLHGLDAPQIDPGNSLRFKLTDIGERDRVDVVLTNPPFGGEEEKGSGPTREVWYYEHPLPEGRKNYTKTAPIQFEEFAPLIAWWDLPGRGKHREESERAWKVRAAELLASGCNLDRKNPSAKEDITHLPPEQLAESILAKERRIAEILGNVKSLLARTK